MIDLVDPVSAGAIFVLHPKTTIVSSIKSNFVNLSKAVLHENYVEKGLSVRQIGVLHGVSKTKVLDALKREGIPVREKGSTASRPSNPPYGKRHYKGRLVDCPREKKIVALIHRLHKKEKLTFRAIARRLAELKIQTRSGSTKWHHFIIRSILEKCNQ